MTTTANLAALIPTDVVVGEMLSVASDRANLLSTCSIQRGMLTAKFAHLASFTAAAVVEGAAVAPVNVVPVATSVTGTASRSAAGADHSPGSGHCAGFP